MLCLDDNKYSAHAGPLDRDIISMPDLRSINKVLSNPESVVQDLAIFNSQKCFAYKGDVTGVGSIIFNWLSCINDYHKLRERNKR
jgi:hypothetical protein